MSLLAFLGGRHDKKAWGRALFASGCKLPEKPDVKKYERATEQIIANDCKIIRECAHIIMTTKSDTVRSKRRMIMFSRFSHVTRLEPFATHKQMEMIREAKALAAKARKYK